ncbi:hypothetical protein CCAX7_21840 [Capsulimonas corticalis]|uniref:Uncharacterized protein n=1 Tax=Capsulimonas corticalis TaxID=2219043 RepID=A0A402D266_9BACT|nr:head GIN domain-containing protein [Capsulimonas corticalis]BDI30133.1 hypothetical protein CCAX7_21840 [Capsulimonas corticalis]
MKIHPVAFVFLVLIIFCFGWAVGFGSAVAHAVGGNTVISTNGNSVTTFGSGGSITIIGDKATCTVQRKCDSFDAIDVSGSVDVDVACQKQQSVSVSGDSNLLPMVHTEVRDHTLYIRTDGSYSTNNPIKVMIAAPDISQITTSGSSDVNVADINNDAFKIDSSGSGEITLAGTTNTLDLACSGSCDIQADALKSSNTTIHISGSGNASVSATQSLNAQVSGSGSVTYSGHPSQTQSNISGSGSVQSAGSGE